MSRSQSPTLKFAAPKASNAFLPNRSTGTFVLDENPRALTPDSPLPTQLPKATVTFAHHYQCALELGPRMTEGHVELPHPVQCQGAKPPVIFSDAT
ncbi:unnamed protein product [Clonostachys byssicola]|uniref:Uncharacterized protein n=1 Tax=Clonostachys byssicola TaxID=160290 RepID=A0A9N9Y2W0_9HYPO|nr:unnamed protein product [Clonostachys byssicola]